MKLICLSWMKHIISEMPVPLVINKFLNYSKKPKCESIAFDGNSINNSLMDFANQIQLGSKGDLVSVNVPYTTGSSSLEYIDFFEVLKRIQSQISRAEKPARN